MTYFRSNSPEVFCKKGVLRNSAKFTGEQLCQSLFFNKVAGFRPLVCNFIYKETVAQVFSCEFCEISKNAFSYRTPLVAASFILTLNTIMTKKYLKHHTYLFYGLLTYLIDSSLLFMFTHMRIVLFSNHAYYMINSKLSS